MYKVTWTYRYCSIEYARDFTDYDEMQKFYDTLYRNDDINWACKYELIARGSFSR